MRLKALGGLILLDADGLQTGRLARPRIRALLALLARSGAIGMSRERLCAYLWPESDATKARHSLEQALHLVRRELGPDVFETSVDPVALNPAVLSSDVARFMTACSDGRFEEAVSAYDGPFLDGFHLSGAPEFERWVDVERTELHRQHTDALTRLALVAEAAGTHAPAVTWWRRLAAVEPLSSRAVLGLMRALARTGDHGGALAAARVHEQLLAGELGAAPDPGVTALADELRQSPPGPQVAASPPVEHSPSSGELAVAVSVASVSTVPDTAPRRPIQQRRFQILVAVAVAVVVTGGYLSRDAMRPATPSRPVVAVLPFSNEAPDSVAGTLGALAADWISGELIRTGLVSVAEAGAPAVVAAQVSGRLYRSGDTLWLQSRISRPAKGDVVAVLDPVALPPNDPAAAFELLRQQVLGVLGTLFDPRLAAWREPALRPPRFDAYRAYATGVEAFSDGRLDLALDAFARAAALDSAYVPPRLWAAWILMIFNQETAADSIIAALRPSTAELSPLDRTWFDRIDASLRGDHERSYRAAQRMLEIAPGTGWSNAVVDAALNTRRAAAARETLLQVSRGRDSEGTLAVIDHMLGEHGRELRTLETGIRRTGSTCWNLMLRARANAALGNPRMLDEDLAELLDGSACDPWDPAMVLLVAALELQAHGHETAAARIRARALDRFRRVNKEPFVGYYAPEWMPLRDGGYRPAEFIRASVVDRVVPALLYLSGEYDAADSMSRVLLRDPEDPVFPRGLLGVVAAKQGKRAEAERWSAELSALERPYMYGDNTLWRAQIAALLGDRREAVELLRQAFAEGLGSGGWSLAHVLPEFEELRGDAEFRRVMDPRR